jgi:hypothetical protein
MIISIVLLASFLPFAFYKYLELKGTGEGRKKSAVERLLDILMLLATLGLLGSVFGIMRGLTEMNPWIFAGSLIIYLAAGTIDEFIFHQDIPKREAQITARKYFCLLIFISVAIFSMVLVEYHRQQRQNSQSHAAPAVEPASAPPAPPVKAEETDKPASPDTKADGDPAASDAKAVKPIGEQ